MHQKTCRSPAAAPTKRTFADKCVTKLELGDEENGALLVLIRV